MFYRAGVLGTVVSPRLVNSLDLYRQSYITADTVKADEQWKQKSAEAAIAIMAKYIDEYHALIDRAYSRYNINHGAFRQRVRDGDESAYDIVNAPLLYLDFYKAFIDSMRSSRVQTSIHYPPIHNFQYYRSRYPNTSLPVTESIAEREVTLPLYPDMTEELVEIVVSSVKASLEKS